jgi:hypothetical protein
VIAKEIRKQARDKAREILHKTERPEEALQMDRVVRFLRIVAVLAIPAAILFVATGNHVQGL